MSYANIQHFRQKIRSILSVSSRSYKITRKIKSPLTWRVKENVSGSITGSELPRANIWQKSMIVEQDRTAPQSYQMISLQEMLTEQDQRRYCRGRDELINLR